VYIRVRSSSSKAFFLTLTFWGRGRGQVLELYRSSVVITQKGSVLRGMFFVVENVLRTNKS
jgi:hypothetical protein